MAARKEAREKAVDGGLPIAIVVENNQYVFYPAQSINYDLIEIVEVVSHVK